LEYDDDGRPKGVAKLFELIKNDLGEDQSDNFKFFYDLMSNQIKYCLAPYLQDDDKQKEKGNIMTPMLLLSMLK
jgi:hypothetical protein